MKQQDERNYFIEISNSTMLVLKNKAEAIKSWNYEFLVKNILFTLGYMKKVL